MNGNLHVIGMNRFMIHYYSNVSVFPDTHFAPGRGLGLSGVHHSCLDGLCTMKLLQLDSIPIYFLAAPYIPKEASFDGHFVKCLWQPLYSLKG